ncbi:hypothetical protein BDR22DRAFT_92475 [Usnea florida]
MFIGGLNWETTDQSLKEYFSTFGEVQECTVMRDGASGRSRGFGFLTFRDPKTVNVVMVKEHYLDGKIIDPKRAIPRDEQERTSKIFVGGVSQDANEHVFKEYFAQFGRVVDATLMMDKDTGRPRGFGFVTFDSEAAVDATLAGDLQILGKPIEVKKAEPRGNMREEEPQGRRGGRGGGRGGKDFRDNDRGFDNNSNQNQGNQNQQGGQNMMGGMTPQMMAQYWQKMQQYFTTMQQQMASAAAMQNGGMGGMGALNPAMMQQMQAMQQMKAMQQMQQAQMGRQQGSQSPLPQSPGAQGGMQGMNPAMLQQMQQMQQMQMQQAQVQAQQQQQGGGGSFNGGGPMGASPGPGFGPGVPRRGTPGYNAQDQLAFEQQKYEQQQARRAAQEAQQMQSYQQGGPTSWEGMYDDVPQPGGRGGGGGGRGGNRGSAGPPAGAPSAPANAPTGPKNAGKPGANYRGGHGGRGGHRGFHPYSR